MRVVSRAHDRCGAETRIRLPASLSEGVVRRVVCDGCRESFEVAADAPSDGPAPANGIAPGEPAAALPPAAATAAVFIRGEGETAKAPAGPGAAATPEPVPPARAGGRDGALAERIDAMRERALDTVDAGRDRLAELVDEGRDRLSGLRESTPAIPRRRLWAWVSVPLALAGVLVGLTLIQGGSEPLPPPAADAGGGNAAEARFIEQPGYSLALPAGWSRTNPPDGAVFAAESDDGSADATLWIEEDPDLSMKQFERRSLRQLGEIGENPRVVDRVNGPTLESSIVELRAETPVADGITAPYRVTLRGAGPYRHYLATSQGAGAPPGIAADVELLHNSLRPEVELGDPKTAGGNG